MKQSTKVKTPKSGNIYDTFVKEMFSQIYIVADFLVHYAKKAFVDTLDLSTLELVNTHFFHQTGQEKIADLVFQCKRKGSDENATVVIVFEHTSKDSRFLPLRLLTYLVGYWNWFRANITGYQCLPTPYSIVLRTGKRPQSKKMSLRDIVLCYAGVDELSIPDFEITVVDVPAIPFDQITGGAEVWMVIGILKKLTEGQEEEFAEALAALTDIEDSTTRTDLLKCALQLTAKVFAGKNKRLDSEAINESIHQAFKGDKKMLPTIFDELEAKGEARGEAKGRVEGRVEEKVECILHILKLRFHQSSTSVSKKLSKITDIEQLTILFERAMYCESLKEFADSLN